jgi:hypothetical protein
MAKEAAVNQRSADSRWSSVYTDKGGWQINQFAGMTDPQAMPDEQFKAGEDQIYIEPFLDYAARGAKVELVGQEKVGTVKHIK